MKALALRNHLLAGMAGITLLGLTTARADQQVTASLDMTTHLSLLVNELDCDNSHGPQITLEGDLTIDSLKMKLIFMNNAKGTHTATVVNEVDVNLLPEGAKITIPKQPSRGGVGGNPHIYLQFNDGNGQTLSQEYYLGRCVQGLNLTPDLVNQALASVNVHADSCTNHKGPFITMDGTLTLGGLHAKLIFRNNVKGTHTREEAIDVTLIQAGTTKIVLPKQPSRGGVGGNPIISIQFLESDGTPMTDPVTLGRCVQL